MITFFTKIDWHNENWVALKQLLWSIGTANTINDGSSPCVHRQKIKGLINLSINLIPLRLEGGIGRGILGRGGFVLTGLNSFLPLPPSQTQFFHGILTFCNFFSLIFLPSRNRFLLLTFFYFKSAIPWLISSCHLCSSEFNITNHLLYALNYLHIWRTIFF